eukprot:TRINITY_DN7568_c0_g1_i1.p1 TRINITY_DN7568_c0_g1~~TRINITY_DN7568_c0_g1_i1.p1  ORF type:complete len:74 (-),score=8.51 TRINITY_DN7568_c0_g1_i1:68-289(-)
MWDKWMHLKSSRILPHSEFQKQYWAKFNLGATVMLGGNSDFGRYATVLKTSAMGVTVRMFGSNETKLIAENNP